MPLAPNTEVIVTIEKPVAGGRMLARHDGQIVLVAGAIPGERVRVRIDRLSKQVAFGETVAVLDPSGDRRKADSDWACGGAFYAHVSYQRQLLLKSEVIADAFARIAKMSLPVLVPVMASQEHGYRMRARLHVKDATFGFFREGTPDFSDPARTGQLLGDTIDALGRLRPLLQRTRITSCELSENAAATERAILLELHPSETSPPHVDAIDGISGLLFTDAHRSHISVSFGTPYVTERIGVSAGAAALTHHVESFFQGNRYLIAELVSRVIAQVPAGTVTDLYAGVGLFAIPFAALGDRRIVAIEGDRASARDLESNSAPYGPAIHVRHLSVESYLQRRDVEAPDTLVIDPPRTGMSKEAMSGILNLKVPRIVYVSCDPPTLARDVKRFAEAAYRLDHIEAFDLFPNSAHVETLAVLVRDR